MLRPELARTNHSSTLALQSSEALTRSPIVVRVVTAIRPRVFRNFARPHHPTRQIFA
jgi:hypothetical protein